MRIFHLLLCCLLFSAADCICEEPAAPASLEITVTDKASGAPVKSVVATIQRLGTEQGFSGDRLQLQNDKGVYKFDTAELAWLHVAILAEGFAPEMALWKKLDGTRQTKIELVKGSLIGGSVVDESGKEIPNVEFTLDISYGAGRESYTAVDLQSDKDGRWSAWIDPDKTKKLIVITKRNPKGFAGPLAFHPNILADSIAKKEIFDCAYKIVLSKGKEIKGRVLLPDGSPAEEAFVSTTFNQDRIECGKDGSFILNVNNSYGMQYEIQAWMTGYAIGSIKFSANDEPNPIEIKLQKARPLKLRISGEDGKPLGKVAISTHSYVNVEAKKRFSPQFSDNDGRFTIEMAPENGIELTLRKEGYKSISAFLIPGDGETAITMPKAKILRGRVFDASSGKELDSFNAEITCEFQHANFSSSRMLSSANDLKSPFSLPIQETVAIGHKNVQNAPSVADVGIVAIGTGFDGNETEETDRRYSANVSAKGYKPMTMSIDTNSGEAIPELAFKLEPLPPESKCKVRILNPDGSPAGGVECAWALPQIFNSKRRMTTEIRNSHCPTSEPDGTVELTLPEESLRRTAELLLSHKDGCAVVKAKDLKDGSELKLDQWSCVKGKWLFAEAHPQMLSLQRQSSLYCDNPEFGMRQSTLSSDGSFVFDRTYPGEFSISAQLPNRTEDFSFSHYMVSASCKQGETLELDLAKDLKLVEFKIALPEDELAKNLVFMANVNIQHGFTMPIGADKANGIRESGNFSIGNIKDGSFKLPVPQKGGFLNLNMMEGSGRNFAGIFNMELKSQESPQTVDLTGNKYLSDMIALKKAPKNRSVSGIVSYPDGTPAENVRLANFCVNDRNFLGNAYDCRTGKGGIFQVDNLPSAGKITCMVMPQEPYSSERIVFEEAAETSKEITLRKETVIKGKVKLPEGYEFPQGGMIMVNARWKSTGYGTSADMEGNFTLKLNEMGAKGNPEEPFEVKLKAEIPGDKSVKPVERTLKVSPGGEYEESFDLKK